MAVWSCPIHESTWQLLQQGAHGKYWGTLKIGLVPPRRYETWDWARHEVTEYIDIICNRQLSHWRQRNHSPAREAATHDVHY